MPCFILYSKAKFSCYSRYFSTSYFCIPVPYNEKDIFFGCNCKRLNIWMLTQNPNTLQGEDNAGTEVESVECGWSLRACASLPAAAAALGAAEPAQTEPRGSRSMPQCGCRAVREQPWHAAPGVQQNRLGQQLSCKCPQKCGFSRFEAEPTLHFQVPGNAVTTGPEMTT